MTTLSICKGLDVNTSYYQVDPNYQEPLLVANGLSEP